MAKEWGCTPWEVREKLTPYWYNTWAILNDEITQKAERDKKRAKAKAK